MGQRYGLPLLSPVDDEGRFTDEAAPFGGTQPSSFSTALFDARGLCLSAFVSECVCVCVPGGLHKRSAFFLSRG